MFTSHRRPQLRDGQDFSVLERRAAVAQVDFPYTPGLLSFREAPVLLDALAKLKHTPDVVMCDGQGVAHPRRLGLASHVGLFLDRPCVGNRPTRSVQPDRSRTFSRELATNGPGVP